MDLTTATPVQIDTALAEIWTRIHAARNHRDSAWKSVERRANWFLGRKMRTSEHAEVMAQAAEFEGEDLASMTVADRRRARIALDLVEAQIAFETAGEAVAEVERETRPYEDEYRSRPWSRFYLVTSSNGHIHSSDSCQTCGLRTQFVILADASGQTEAEAIAERDKRDSAALLCTVCFPNAPVKWTEKPEDAALCPGSGTAKYPAETARKGYASGNYGVCSHCGQAITISKIGNMRKHKKVPAAV
jgi:hypothetical protein